MVRLEELAIEEFDTPSFQELPVEEFDIAAPEQPIGATREFPAEEIAAPPTGFERLAGEIGPEPRRVLLPGERQQIAEEAAGVALPAAGAVIGGLTGIPGGVPVGAGVGRFLFEGLRNISSQEKKPLFDIHGQSLVGNAILEGLYTELGGQVIGKVAQSGAAKELAALYNKAKTDIAPTLASKITGSLGKFLSQTLGRVPKERLAEHTGKLANKIAVQTNIPELAVKRTIDRGPRTVLNPKNWNIKKPTIQPKTIERVSNISEQSFDAASKAYNSQVSPILNKFKGLVNADDILRQYSDDMLPLFEVKQILNKKGQRVGEKLIATAASDRETARIMTMFTKEVERTFEKGVTPKDLHKFKQFINKVMKNSAIKNNPNVQKPLLSMHRGIRNTLDDAVPGYKPITDEFRDIFKLQDEFGRRFESQRVEQLLRDYFNPDKQAFREGIDSLVGKSKTAQRVFEDALDERAALYFRDVISKSGKTVAAPIPGTPLRVGLQFQTRAPEKLARGLLRKERMGFAPAGARVQKGISSVLLGQPPQRAEELIFE